jgi:GT2 family glycosyltransferase
MSDAPDVSVVIPSWNTRELLDACLRSLARPERAAPRLEVIVVDNGSADGSADHVARAFPGVVLVRNERNEGFARASNQGLRLARGRHALLLNTDTEVLGDALQLLVAFLDAHPEYGAVAPRLVHPDGRTQRTVQAFPNLWTPLFFATPLERWFPRSHELERYFLRGWDQESSRDVEQPPAACLLLRREVLERVGFFDEELWLFFNDVDLSRRLQAAGWKTRYLAEARVLHHVGASTAKFAGFVGEWQKNRLAYYRKHHGRLAGAWIKLCATLAFVDWAARQLGRRMRRRAAEPIGPTARLFLAFLGS